ncbi:MAG: glycosyltransferase family 2 protein [Candidatus Hydrogenedentes bacterium]|nr:glycosyltransferase family 2 protein [Candidatus Hydrogenedentota bacterium]
MNLLVSVVVPFYNEEDNVVPLLERVEAVFSGMPECDYECLFVNDGSTDATRARLEAAREKNPRVRPIHLVNNRGQSAALVAGMRRAQGDYILTLDGDLQNDPSDFPEMLALLKDYDCVCGYRANRQDNWVRKISSRIGNGARQRILNDGIRDAGCGSKGFRRECVEHIIPFNGVHRYFAVMMRNAGMTIAECPVTHHPRVHGVSKYGINNRLWRGIYDLIGVGWLRKRYVTFQVEGEL